MKDNVRGIKTMLLICWTCIIGVFSLCFQVQASEDAIGCVKSLAIPLSYSAFIARLPTTIEVRIKIGEGGKARAVTYDTRIEELGIHLDGYFKDKTRYLDACKGKT